MLRGSSFIAILGAVCASALAHGDQNAASYRPPRTLDGHPSFEGNWTNATITSLQRPARYAALVIPPGDRDVVEKLKLDGRFTMTNAHFTNVNVGQKITELSQRARGKQPDPQATPVGSDFAGQFMLDGGKLTIPAVAFDVPGAGVRLAGYYNLRQEDMDFRGSLLTDAKVSQMTTGWKSWLLKVLDPLFGRDGGGSSIPIKVTGTRKAPSFGLDTGRVFSRGKDKDVPKL